MNKLRDHEDNVQLNLKFSAHNIELFLGSGEVNDPTGWKVAPFSLPCAVSINHRFYATFYSNIFPLHRYHSNRLVLLVMIRMYLFLQCV